MNNIFSLIDEIKKRPELYIGSKEITHLYHFINGYIYRDFEYNEDLCSKFKKFHFWLPKMTGVDDENWKNNLLIFSDFNEVKALNLFFLYFEKYVKYLEGNNGTD